MDGMGAGDDLRRRLGEADVADLASLHEIGERPDRLLDRRGGIDAMLIIEIDVIRTEALQRSITSGFRVFGRPFEALPAAVLATDDPELGRQGDLLTTPLQGLADQH